MRHHHRHRRKKSFWRWVPVAIAVVLIVAAFIVAPSLQPPPPKTQITTPLAVQDLGRSLAEPKPSDRPLVPQPAPPDMSVRRATPDGAVAQRPDPQKPSGDSTAKRDRKRRAASPRPAPPPAQDDASADLNVRWNRAN